MSPLRVSLLVVLLFLGGSAPSNRVAASSELDKPHAAGHLLGDSSSRASTSRSLLAPAPPRCQGALRRGIKAPIDTGLMALPYYKSWYFPGPSPANFSQPFDLTMPEGKMTWYLEQETGIYRSPQRRIVFGPIKGLPSLLLLKGTINIGGDAKSAASQGAMYLHQELDYKGGPELGWVYLCSSRGLSRYLMINANMKPGQVGQACAVASNSYLGRYMSYRLAFNASARSTFAHVYSGSSALYDANEAWPAWFTYNNTKPWYVTITWQRNEDAAITASIGGASLWYKE